MSDRNNPSNLESRKPCPFCGSTDLEACHKPDPCPESYPDGVWVIECGGCGALGPFCEEHQNATKTWNDRGEVETSADCHGLDNTRQVFFYEQDFYVLSNFSAFSLWWKGLHFPTSEHAYQWSKFWLTGNDSIMETIRHAPSAHEAFKAAESYRNYCRNDWPDVKVEVMRSLLRAKAEQHEYVRRKLEATGDRELIENSWRDAYWGWGPNRGGQNMLGRLWMEVRAERRAVKTSTSRADVERIGTNCGPNTPWDLLCVDPTCTYCGTRKPVCQTCKTELAFEGDTCGLCHPEVMP